MPVGEAGLPGGPLGGAAPAGGFRAGPGGGYPLGHQVVDVHAALAAREYETITMPAVRLITAR